MKRYDSIDAFKAIAAFFVVYIHTSKESLLDGIILLLTRIAVPYFFIVTGFFLWNVNIEKIKIQIFRMIKLIILSNTIFFIYNIIKSYKCINIYLKNIISFNSIKKLILFNVTPIQFHLWYLNAILYVLLIYYITCKFKVVKFVYLFIPLLLLGDLIFGKYSLLIFKKEFPLEYVRNFFFVGIPYFYLGNFIRYKVNEIEIKTSNYFFIIGCMIFYITSLIESYVLNKINMSSIREHYLSTTFLVCCLFIYLIKNRHLFKNSILKKIGREYSVYIYIFHPIFIDILKNIISKFDDFFINLYSYFSSFIIYFLTVFILYIIKKLYHIIAIKISSPVS